jgi:photosynthetic reaction center cytochrome c subunit
MKGGWMIRPVQVVASIFVIAASVSFIGAVKAQPTRTSQPSSSQASTSPLAIKKAEEQFKNIQVLKGVPADQLFPTMQFISASLGVECDYCHVQGAFEKDDKKPKQFARKMMEMMFAINKDNFEGHRAVTCYSCHRGNAKPAAIPVVMSDEANRTTPNMPSPAPEAKDSQQNSGPSGDQLLEKFVQASGGAAAIDKISTRVMKGTMDFGGKSVSIDIYAKDPGKRISFAHMPEGDSVTAFNGQEGWLGAPGRPPREMHGSDLDGAAIDADLHLPSHLRQMFSQLLVEQPEKIGDQQVNVVSGQREGKPPIILYFDQQSGLLVRLVRYGETALGWLPTQIDYADYRDADGVKVPYRWTLARPSGRFTIQLSELKQNVPVDDAKYVKPPAPPEASKGPTK